MYLIEPIERDGDSTKLKYRRQKSNLGLLKAAFVPKIEQSSIHIKLLAGASIQKSD